MKSAERPLVAGAVTHYQETRQIQLLEGGRWQLFLFFFFFFYCFGEQERTGIASLFHFCWKVWSLPYQLIYSNIQIHVNTTGTTAVSVFDQFSGEDLPYVCVGVHILAASHFHWEINYIYAVCVCVVISIFFICEITALLGQLHQPPHLFHVREYSALI